MLLHAGSTRAGLLGLSLIVALAMGGCPTDVEDGTLDPANPPSRETSEGGGGGGRTSGEPGKTRTGDSTDGSDTAPTDDAGGPGAPTPDAPPRPDDARRPDRPDTGGSSPRDTDDAGGGQNDPNHDGGDAGGGDPGNDPGNGGGDPGPDGGQNGPTGQDDPTGGAPDLQGDELAFIEAIVVGGRRAMSLATTHVPLVTQAVFIASGANQGALTTTGTLTLDAQGNATAYAPDPTDRLVLAGESSRVEYRIAAFEGDFSGTFEFEQSHSDLRFRVTVEGDCELTIASVAGNGQFERHIDGTVMLSRGPAAVAIVHGDASQFDPDAAQLFSGTSITGTVQAAGGTIDVRELFDTKFIGSVFQFKLTIASTANRGGRAYECRDVFYAMVERDGFPVEPDFWRDNGQLLRDGVTIGEFDLDRIISPDLPSPGRVLNLVNGEQIGV